MYTINLQAGTVTRDEDGKVISPCQEVKTGIGYLQTIGILTEERANQILI